MSQDENPRLPPDMANSSVNKTMNEGLGAREDMENTPGKVQWSTNPTTVQYTREQENYIARSAQQAKSIFNSGLYWSFQTYAALHRCIKYFIGLIFFIAGSALFDTVFNTSNCSSAKNLYELGWANYREFRRLGTPNNLKKSIECFSRAIELAPEGHSNLSQWLTDLGMAYWDQFERTGELEDLDRSIDHVSRAIELSPKDHPDMPHWLAGLGMSFTQRYQRFGELGDLNSSVKHYSRSIAVTPDDHPDMSYRLFNLGVCYSDRYRRLKEAGDLDKSIEHASRALVLTPDRNPDMTRRLAGLGLSHHDRFMLLNELSDLEKAIEYYSRSTAVTSEGRLDMIQLANLGLCHGHRFERIGELEDLNKWIEYRARALSMAPEGHKLLLRWLIDLGIAYADRFERLNDYDDLEKSIEHVLDALKLIINDHPDLSRLHASLGVSYNQRFRRLGQLADLENAIEHTSHALALTPDGHSNMPRRLANLALSYLHRFQRLGSLEDLDKSIGYRFSAVSLTPDDHPDMPYRLASLGEAYISRLRHLGELEDLEKSIEYFSRAVALTPEKDSNLPYRLASLSLPYDDRFRRLGQLKDLEKSIEYRSHALSLTPNGHPDVSSWLSSLGTSLGQRFQSLGVLGDLHKSIEHISRAIALASDDHPEISGWLSHLGMSYRLRFRHTGEIEDLERSVKYHSRALVLTHEGDPELPRRHFNCAASFVLQYQTSGDTLHLNNALDSFRGVSQTLTGAPRLKFQCALQWASLASEYNSLNPVEAYQVIMELLPQFIWLGATTQQRYRDLSIAENLAVNAAFVAILSSNACLALEWLEHARCIVWNQRLMLRSPLNQLHSSHPDLAARLQTVSTELHTAHSETEDMQVVFSKSIFPEQAAQQRRRLAIEYQHLLAQARQLPGFEDFLQPLKASLLTHASQNGPIVVINCHSTRCDALLVLPKNDSIGHLPLSRFNQKKAQMVCSEMVRSLRQKQLRERGVKIRHPGGHKDDIESVLATLWNDLVRPVLDFLGYINHDMRDDLPHITWCPTGLLSFLPLHAAGDYNQPESRIFDYAISSYAPTLTALLASTPNSLTPDCRVLAIGQANTPGRTPLPGTAKELQYLKAHAYGKVKYSQLLDDRATTKAVLDAMEQHDWVHLACHAHQNANDPTKSGFFLHDGTLDLASINRRSFKNKGLAFLSACQTATGDEKLPDEAVHLASGMLMAGYPSVIATMWSVVDEDAPFVADRVYAQLMKDGKIGNGEAGKALHHSVAALREKVGEKEFGRWAPYIHMGS